MNSIRLAWASIQSRGLHSVLCVTGIAAGIALLCAVFLLSQGISDGFVRNARSIDVIVGAKGSPLQLVLSSVYHADIPAGNIDMKDYEKVRKHPRVKNAIPLALGDSYRGWRMVGTIPAYIALYGGEFAQGRAFDKDFETVAGAATGLKVGETFAVSHGFSADSDDVHDYKLYTVTGVLKPTGTVLDKLLTTNVGSVQQLHAHHEQPGHAHEDDEDPAEVAAEEAMAHQVTAVLLSLRSPIDRINFPRQINQSSDIMAAQPAYEMARFAKSLGIGRTLVVVLGIGFVVLSALMLLSSLASGLALRRYDLAVLRVLGGSPFRLFTTVVAEGLILSGAGTIIGIAGGHVIAFVVANAVDSLYGIMLPGSMLAVQPLDAGLLLIGVLAGLIASLIPAVSAGRTDIAVLLARGRA